MSLKMYKNIKTKQYQNRKTEILALITAAIWLWITISTSILVVQVNGKASHSNEKTNHSVNLTRSADCAAKRFITESMDGVKSR